MNTLFRNEGAGVSSELITEAVAATWSEFGSPPALGMVTFVDRDKTRSKRDPGLCYVHAGFLPCGETQSGLLALQLRPFWMPAPERAIGSQAPLFAREAA